MFWFMLTALIAGSVPWTVACRGVRGTTLRHALVWMFAAWFSWILSAFTDEAAAPRLPALCLTACAGVAVLGARRPHVGAWNFVVLCLFAVMVVPLLEGLVVGTSTLGPLRLLFLGATLAVGVVNHVPTRFGVAAFAVGGAVTLEWFSFQSAATVLIALTPWFAWLGWKIPRTGTTLDKTWRDFRDRFGLFWGLRMREMFNLSARNAGSQVQLSWTKFKPAPMSPEEEESLEQLLAGILQRFKEPDLFTPKGVIPNSPGSR